MLTCSCGRVSEIAATAWVCLCGKQHGVIIVASSSETKILTRGDNDDRLERIRERVDFFNRLVSWLRFFANDADAGVGDVYLRMKSRATGEIANHLDELAMRFSCCGREACENLNLHYPIQR